MIKAVFESWENGLSSLILASLDGQNAVNIAIVDRRTNKTFTDFYKFTDEELAKETYQKLLDEIPI